MNLPALNDAVLITFSDQVTGEWACVVGDQTNQVYGMTVGMTPLKATSKAVDVLTGKATAATLRPFTEAIRADIIRSARGFWVADQEIAA